MAEKLGLGSEVRQLKLGPSFTNPKSSAFHTIKYDFKPASVDTNKIATVDVGTNHQVTVTVPHLDGAGVPQTVFKGSQRPYQKECVLIIDRVTGEITLEKLACNIQVKKTRSELAKLPLPQEARSDVGKLRNDLAKLPLPQERLGQSSDKPGPPANISARAQTPPIGQVGQRISHKTKVTSGSRRADRQITHLVPKHSPLHASPSYPSPHHNKSPKQTNELHNNPSTLASLPMIGMDDFCDPAPVAPPSIPSVVTTPAQTTTDKSPPPVFRPDTENGIGEITDSSSSSSDSDSDSDPDVTVFEGQQPFGKTTNGHTNGNAAPSKLSNHLLNEDLCLSESGSDSD